MNMEVNKHKHEMHLIIKLRLSKQNFYNPKKIKRISSMHKEESRLTIDSITRLHIRI